MKIQFDENAKKNDDIDKIVSDFLSTVPTLEKKLDMSVIIFQDGKNGAYYIKCSIQATVATNLVDLNAKLDIDNSESFRANRELLTTHKTYQAMKIDAEEGREFNDIIVEYNTDYDKTKPLKVWGGQHRTNAISEAKNKSNRHHGFRIYFALSKKQRTEVALISNTNINVSNDTFDRMLEETFFGDILRKWCQQVGFLAKDEDFPSVGSKVEKITVKLARSFVVNYYLGKEKVGQLKSNEIDKNVYEPYLTETGVTIDQKYKEIMDKVGKKLIEDAQLSEAGKRFLALHNAQQRAVKEGKGKIENKKTFRNKAFIESVLCAWAYIAGLLQSDSKRLQNHYRIPKTTTAIPDPLNAKEMSKFKHDSDPPTYRGLGTRSALKDRQRVAQMFLAKSLHDNSILDKKFLNGAVSTVVGILSLSKGYTRNV
jgi:hypothetical protein